MDRFMHGDEPMLQAERDRADAARRDYLADHGDDLEPLPSFDLAMIDGAEAEIRAAQQLIAGGHADQIDYREVAVGLVNDYGDTLKRALAFYRNSLSKAS